MAFLTLAWGMNWSVMKIGATQLPPLWFRTLGLVLGTALLGAALVVRGQPLRAPRDAWRTIVVVSFANIVVWYLLVTLAVTRMPVGRAAILGFSMPAWAALIGFVVYRERLAWPTAVGVACATAGVLLLVGDDLEGLAAHPAGVAMMLVAAFAWGWGTHVLARARLAVDTAVLTFWMMSIASVCLFVASLVFEASRWRIPVGVEWGPILYSAVVVLAIGNLVWFTVTRTLSPVAAGLSSMLIPVVGIFSGAAMLDERPGWREYVALVLVSVAVVAGLARKESRLHS